MTVWFYLCKQLFEFFILFIVMYIEEGLIEAETFITYIRSE